MQQRAIERLVPCTQQGNTFLMIFKGCTGWWDSKYIISKALSFQFYIEKTFANIQQMFHVAEVESVFCTDVRTSAADSIQLYSCDYE